MHVLTRGLSQVFIFPMRTMASVDEKTLYSIFSNVEVLINCNKEMLTQLEQVMHDNEGSDDVVIGFVFTQLVRRRSMLPELLSFFTRC